MSRLTAKRLYLMRRAAPALCVGLLMTGTVARALTPTPTATPMPTATPLATATSTCAPTATPYCATHCEPCPTIRPFCYAQACGECHENPVCAPGEECVPQGNGGCCSCQAVTPTADDDSCAVTPGASRGAWAVLGALLLIGVRGALVRRRQQ